MTTTGTIHNRPVEISDTDNDLNFSFTDVEEGFYYVIKNGYTHLREMHELEHSYSVKGMEDESNVYFDESIVMTSVKKAAPEWIEQHFEDWERVEA